MAEINVLVVYALPEKQTVIKTKIAKGANVQDAIDASGIVEQHPELANDDLTIGIFSKKVELSHVVTEGDRIEIYRPLTIDPKTARMKRAKK